MTAKSAKLTMKILLIVGILCFFLPFMLLSCESTDLVEASGMDMVIGEFKDTEGEKVDEEDMTPELANDIKKSIKYLTDMTVDLD